MLKPVDIETIKLFKDVFSPLHGRNTYYYINVYATDDLGIELLNHYRNFDRTSFYHSNTHAKYILNEKIFRYSGYFINQKSDKCDELVIKFTLEK